MKTKQDITTAIIEILEIDISQPKSSVTDLMFKWWATGRTGSGLRLTEDGMEAFTQAEIEHFDFPVFADKKFKGLKKEDLKKFTLNLGKKLKCPWYIGLKNQQAQSAYIRVYDSKIAMMITLYGSFLEYIESAKT
jgi:hypothetical protein